MALPDSPEFPDLCNPRQTLEYDVELLLKKEYLIYVNEILISIIKYQFRRRLEQQRDRRE